MNFGREVTAMRSFILDQVLLIKQSQKLANEQSFSDCENNSELIKSLLDQIEYLRRENSGKSNIISSLINNKVLFNNKENLIRIDISKFENPKRDTKSEVIAENKTKSNNFVLPNRFTNNYGQFENIVDFNKEIAHVTS